MLVYRPRSQIQYYERDRENKRSEKLEIYKTASIYSNRFYNFKFFPLVGENRATQKIVYKGTCIYFPSKIIMNSTSKQDPNAHAYKRI